MLVVVVAVRLRSEAGAWAVTSPANTPSREPGYSDFLCACAGPKTGSRGTTHAQYSTSTPDDSHADALIVPLPSTAVPAAFYYFAFVDLEARAALPSSHFLSGSKPTHINCYLALTTKYGVFADEGVVFETFRASQ